ncbi:hypothetical protein CLOM_g11061 [Closterium sp. NIES-68]|nr:hypothetical protein CLOM_g11061 [Closterium sp. NIES-68]GJP60156.1 hypothetical protein CLOP_g17290 [Closterium sp. NIES-67]
MTSLFVPSSLSLQHQSFLSYGKPTPSNRHPFSAASSSVRFGSCAKQHRYVTTPCTCSSSSSNPTSSSSPTSSPSSPSSPSSSSPSPPSDLRTCRNCKQPFNPADNHPMACRHHTAHYGGETKRKFESVYTGGTMDTVGGGEITAYWHCCGATDPFDPGCVAGPHETYDD